MRKPSEGNRLLLGDSGIPFEVPENVATGLVDGGDADYADGLGDHRNRRARSAKAAKAVTTEEEDATGEVDLKKLTIPQLKELAATRDIDLGDASKRDEIIEVIFAALDDDE